MQKRGEGINNNEKTVRVDVMMPKEDFTKNSTKRTMLLFFVSFFSSVQVCVCVWLEVIERTRASIFLKNDTTLSSKTLK
jgi:hypothetical protein